MQDKGRWNLDPLYSGLDDPQLEKDMKELQSLVEESKDFFDREKDRKELIIEAVALFEKTSSIAHRLAPYLSISYSADTSSSQIMALLNQMQMLLAGFQPFTVATSRLIEQADIEELLKEESLKDYEFFLKRTKQEAQYLLPAEIEELIARLNIYGTGAFENLFDQLTSSATTEMDGKELSLTEVRNLASDPDQDVRHKAYKAELALYPKIEQSVAKALESIKGQVKYLSKRRGYDSPLDEALFKGRMKRTTLDALIEAMIEKKDIFVRYYKAKAAYLGQEQLHWADIYAPMGKLPSGYTVEDAHEMLVKSFTKLHKPIAETMDRAFKNEWIDFYPRKGKVGGAFCCNLPVIKQSRVLTNFDGSFGSVNTLAHELGHAYHGTRIEDHKPLNQNYTMPVAETASNFNEFHFVLEQLDRNEDKEIKLGLLDNFLTNNSQVICDILSRFLFEKEVFERVGQESLTSEDLQEIMLSAQKKAFADGLDQDSLHPYMWACKSHYYSTSLSFYNFPYAFGALFSVALYQKARAEGEAFMKKYDELLTSTTVSTVEESGRLVGLDLEDKNTWLESMDFFEPYVSEFEELVEELK